MVRLELHCLHIEVQCVEVVFVITGHYFILHKKRNLYQFSDVKLKTGKVFTHIAMQYAIIFYFIASLIAPSSSS